MQRKQKTGIELSLEITPWWEGGRGCLSKHKLWYAGRRECLKTQIIIRGRAAGMSQNTQIISDFFHAMCWGVSQTQNITFFFYYFRFLSCHVLEGITKHKAALMIFLCSHMFRDFQPNTSHFCFTEHLSLLYTEALKPVSDSMWQSVALLDHN